MMNFNVNLLQWSKISGETIKSEIISNKKLSEELHKPVIRKFEKRKVHSPLLENMWAQI